MVARVAPDGQALLVTANSHAINPLALRNMPFDTVRAPAEADRPRAQGSSPGGGPTEALGREVAEDAAERGRVTRAAGIRRE